MSCRCVVPIEPCGHVHLDPVGGIAGDMFVAALLDARPDLEPALHRALAGSGLPEGCTVGTTSDRRGGVSGRRFEVRAPGAPPSGDLATVLARLERADLEPAIARRAASIYRRLGEAEAAVHGVPVEHVHFHELADWDSYADIVAAAFLIEALGAATWSTGPLPLGSGTVATAHGILPVPAPATVRLLAGLPVLDDGLPGERVTPTGAAILAELAPAPRAPERPVRLLATGHGLGARELAGKPNLLRVLLFGGPIEEVDTAGGERVESIAVLRFEIDDQSAEELAQGLDRLRARPDVLDVCQWPVVGKRGRLATAVQLLCPRPAAEAVARACLVETATSGVRITATERRILAREIVSVSSPAGPIRVKRVRRPDGSASAKAELVDLVAAAPSLPERERLRREVERMALEADRPVEAER